MNDRKAIFNRRTKIDYEQFSEPALFGLTNVLQPCCGVGERYTENDSVRLTSLLRHFDVVARQLHAFPAVAQRFALSRS